MYGLGSRKCVGVEVQQMRNLGSILKLRFIRLNIRAYLDPEEPTFLGLLVMISLYKS